MLCIFPALRTGSVHWTNHQLCLQAVLLRILGLVWAGRMHLEEGAPISLPTSLLAGTLEERGLHSEQPWKVRAGDCHLHGERGKASQAHRLPTGLRRLLPSSCKAFPCCFLCPRSEEEEEGSRATEEGTAAPGEGTHLLPKPSCGELQPTIRPSQTDVPAWHTVA